MENEEIKNNWRVERINLHFIDYGENKGQYSGSIEFENGENESFKFNIIPNMANKYIELISDDIVRGASNLAVKLLESLKKQGLINEATV